MEETVEDTEIHGYVPGYPDQYSTYPARVHVRPEAQGCVDVQVRFAVEGKEYRCGLRLKPQDTGLVPLTTESLKKAARRGLAKLGALVWPPPTTDRRAWGLT